MFAFLTKLLLIVRSRLRSRARLEAENLVLRRQVLILSRKSPSRVRLGNLDRLILVWLYRTVRDFECDHGGEAGDRSPVAPAPLPSLLALESRRLGGRPGINRELRDLIRRMRRENSLWRAPRIHGELLMLGIQVAQSTIAKRTTKLGVAEARQSVLPSLQPRNCITAKQRIIRGRPATIPTRAHSRLEIPRRPAATMLGILPGINIPPLISRPISTARC
jgi:hypothetical protein